VSKREAASRSTTRSIRRRDIKTRAARGNETRAARLASTGESSRKYHAASHSAKSGGIKRTAALACRTGVAWA